MPADSPTADADTLVVQIPAGIGGVWDLLHLLAAELRFPGYFGGNFDALDECLRDLAWLPAGQKVRLNHADLPLLFGSHAREAYLGVLASAIRYWRTNGTRRFEVVFPSGIGLAEVEQFRDG